jgi:hypothetical protein
MVDVSGGQKSAPSRGRHGLLALAAAGVIGLLTACASPFGSAAQPVQTPTNRTAGGGHGPDMPEVGGQGGVGAGDAIGSGGGINGVGGGAM